uniref:Uncharacterized protein n=1 Tax=Brassica oleracea TaxID=3712 RepID=A0A3P6DK10_BRAOL|nr:unnamed protein product [Brassica oleracea]
MRLPSMLSQLQLPLSLHPLFLLSKYGRHFQDQNAHGVVDLTATKDVESHVPSLEENHLANELSKSPLICGYTHLATSRSRVGSILQHSLY